ncbi:amino acid transporter [Candidatus Scalindua japonica]|uniref:Amino acid transporter n=1 Tax=Candidatus Scalindua japonica TaxID=1284222 RepID=A0A286U2R7_9BACT|nr:hypothetical protein [Candidatus Scalindua japonica]GAX62415.1 amino acid transporter [Candidatus Scalindua japonica]
MRLRKQKESSRRLPGTDFHVVELELFKDEQIKAFAETWYMVTGEWKGWRQYAAR